MPVKHLVSAIVIWMAGAFLSICPANAQTTPNSPRWGYQFLTGYELQDPTRPYDSAPNWVDGRPGPPRNPQIATYIAYSNVKDMGPADGSGDAGSSANFYTGFIAKDGEKRATEMNLQCRGVYWRSFSSKAEADASLQRQLADFRRSSGSKKQELVFDDFKAVASTRRYIRAR